MARKANIYQNDVGKRLVLYVVDKDGTALTGVAVATTMQIKVTLPSGTVKTFTATHGTSPYGDGSGSNGAIEYRLASTADLPESGNHEYRGYLEYTENAQQFKVHTQPSTFYVGSVAS